MSETELVKNEDDNRYEVHVDGERIGFIDYVRDVDVIDLVHTEVEPAHGGKGYAQKLADYALADIRDTGLLVRPTCGFVAKHIDRNPEYGTLVAAD
ncbi:N-acetyltransferase [Tessaracoccus sp. OS52]|uniref:GNAT family N-acetyltransferase n=1 Tax=Tessaracoccus sp. OS52 TaxID=2886691 RepID=UPI001D10175B|nr:GNAT family N-acetyltransferase [Tessaracoccus sp. OS52]MCC2592853.1 N-acetyltransferase [Tessaracoccus sp. OS52]